MSWKLTSPGRLYDRAEEYVVYYHLDSGNTHMINGLATDILTALAGGPRNTEELCRLDSPELEGMATADAHSHIETMMQQLQVVDLVEPCL